MSRAWAWLTAAVMAAVGWLAWLVGRRGRRAVVVTDPRPGIDAEMRTSEESARRDMEAVDAGLARDTEASAERAARDARILASDVDALHARFRRRVGGG